MYNVQSLYESVLYLQNVRYSLRKISRNSQQLKFLWTFPL